jgi:DNA-binding MarR family transcriptional regulator
VKAKITAGEYRVPLEPRYRIQRFLHDANNLAGEAGLSPQHYRMMLAIRGLPSGGQATIGALAGRVALRHHNAVELVDRLEERSYLRRSRGEKDRRLVKVSLLLSGERLLEEVVRRRLGALPSNGRLAQAIDQNTGIPVPASNP